MVKQLAMRRTLFVFPRDLLPSACGSASARVATQVRTRQAKEGLDGRRVGTVYPSALMRSAR